jgi:hypothetical protein
MKMENAYYSALILYCSQIRRVIIVRHALILVELAICRITQSIVNHVYKDIFIRMESASFNVLGVNMASSSME